MMGHYIMLSTFLGMGGQGEGRVINNRTFIMTHSQGGVGWRRNDTPMAGL